MGNSKVEAAMLKVAQVLDGYNMKHADDDDLKQELKTKHRIQEDDADAAVLQMNQLGYIRLEVIDEVYYVHLTTKGLRWFREGEGAM